MRVVMIDGEVQPVVLEDVRAYVKMRIPGKPREIPGRSNRNAFSLHDLKKALGVVESFGRSVGDVISRLFSLLGRIRTAAGIITPDKISDIQKIHLQPKRSVKTPPRINPRLN
jgi:hypothetical protein